MVGENPGYLFCRSSDLSRFLVKKSIPNCEMLGKELWSNLAHHQARPMVWATDEVASHGLDRKGRRSCGQRILRLPQSKLDCLDGLSFPIPTEVRRKPCCAIKTPTTMHETGQETSLFVIRGGVGLETWVYAYSICPRINALVCASFKIIHRSHMSYPQLGNISRTGKANHALFEVPGTVKYLACIASLPVFAAVLPGTSNYCKPVS